VNKVAFDLIEVSFQSMFLGGDKHAAGFMLGACARL